MTSLESEDDEEVNAVEAVQEIVEITVDSGAAQSVWPRNRENEVEEGSEVGGGNWKSHSSRRRCKDWNSFEMGGNAA